MNNNLTKQALPNTLLANIDAYWRAANYLSVGQIYLYDNPLLKRPLKLSDIKRMLLGHWGTTSGQNFIYVHLNRIIKKNDLNMIYVPVLVTGGRRWLPTLISKAATAKSIPTSARTKWAEKICSNSFHFPAASPVMLRPQHRAPSTKAANWDTL